ncbi:MAG TPA: helix-turn-helix transcriptional regulator [Tepidiformaceae bacterium]|nr:helix-turn-helix transcriptional regulator [Tepidiformaceae bacterium]
MDENQAWFLRRHEDPEYLFELLATDLGEAIVARMEAAGINRTELAERMGVSRARVSQVLGGHDNLTLKTLVAVAHALDTSLSIGFEPRRRVMNVSAWKPFAHASATRRDPSLSKAA